jgi:nucleotide-binding universal stress UspA family protein
VAKVVVGVDGSPGSVAALRFAADWARQRHAELTVVCVYATDALGGPLFVPSEFGVAGYLATEVRSTLDDSEARWLQHRHELADAHRARAEDAVASAIAHLQPELGGRGIERRLVADRHPADVLVEASDGAELLVVGRRGRGGFEALILGSVSRACVEHARCPVVVMPPRH